MTAPPDSAFPLLIDRLPAAIRPYALLARLDRPAGIWLLFLPCLIGLAFQRLPENLHYIDLLWTTLFFAGAIVMRGAGCTWNDISDSQIDAGVARTASRPIPSGQISLGNAYAFLGLQLFIGFLVWFALPNDAKIVALLSLPLVAAYPFMKRFTWWPQAWLGATFNWGVLVGAATAATINLPSVVLYVGLALWTVAYDTIYALQDREDDALMGVKSTARLFGDRAVLGAFCFHLGAAALIAIAAAFNGAGRAGAVTALAFLVHGIWQVFRLKVTNEKDALGVFKSNVLAGALVAFGFLVAAMAPERKQDTLYADEEIVEGNRADTYDLPWFDLRVSKTDPRRKTWFVSDARRALELEGIPIPEAREDETAPETRRKPR